MSNPFPFLRSGASKVLCAAALAVAAAGVNAAPVTVGDAAINRTQFDGFSNFVIALPGESFLASGTFDQWNVFAAVSGPLGLLILNGSPAAPTVVHALSQTVAVGLTTFTLGSPLSVSAGDYLGIWMASGKVDFDFSATGVTYSGNGTYAAMPTVGSVLVTNGPNAIARDYSINVRFTEASTGGTVPEPGTLSLLAVSLLGLAAVRRQTR